MSSIRIKKEIEALLWPWAAVLFGMILLTMQDAVLSDVFHLSAFRWMAFWFGVPLLASLSMGHEFQYNTVPLLFSQPMDRIRAWREKWFVLIPAVGSATVTYILCDDILFLDKAQDPAVAAMWAVIAVSGATFWTLVARSSTNGFILNLLQLASMAILADIFDLTSRVSGGLRFYGLAAGIAYSLLMLGLSLRKLKAFEVAGALPSGQSISAGSLVSGGLFSGFLRAKTAQPLRNLIRKELRLQWPLWLLMGICSLGEAAMVLLQFVPGVAKDTPPLVAVTSIFIVSAVLAVFAGSMSSSEERISGTYAAQRTLPVSTAKLWVVKVAVSLFTALIGLGLPCLIGVIVFRGNFVHTSGVADLLKFGLLAVPMLASVGFCCGCVARGTLRAAVLVVPVIALTDLISGLNFYFADLFTENSILDSIILRFHPFPFRFSTLIAVSGRNNLIEWAPAAFVVVALVVSYRLFRREIPDSVRSGVVALVPFVVVALLISVLGSLPEAIVRRSVDTWGAALIEAQIAVSKLPPSPEPREVSAEDLSKAGAISDTSLKLLRETTISVGPGSFAVRFKDGRQCTARGGRYERCAYWWSD